jgi:AcrR family transcriptional regulator
VPTRIGIPTTGTAAGVDQRERASIRAAIERSGGDFTMAEIAREPGVTRQTVYRYFANADALLTATALAGTGRFLDILTAHLHHLSGPAEAVVERHRLHP